MGTPAKQQDGPLRGQCAAVGGKEKRGPYGETCEGLRRLDKGPPGLVRPFRNDKGEGSGSGCPGVGLEEMVKQRRQEGEIRVAPSIFTVESMGENRVTPGTKPRAFVIPRTGHEVNRVRSACGLGELENRVDDGPVRSGRLTHPSRQRVGNVIVFGVDVFENWRNGVFGRHKPELLHDALNVRIARPTPA